MMAALHGTVPGLLFQISREWHTAVDRRMARYGLTFRQAALLLRCFHNRGANLNRLMPHMGTDNAGISRLADRLEAAGLVRRIPGEDRRSVSLEPTPEGERLCPELERVLGETARELIAGFTQEEQKQAEDMLKRILDNAARIKSGSD